MHIHKTIPQTVGIKKLAKVHFKLPVSFFIVSKVVAQGKCKIVNIITLIAVNKVHPLATKILPISKVLSISINVFAFK